MTINDKGGGVMELKPCPFCGDIPEAPKEFYGTQYEIECNCTMAISSVQISDHMTIDERLNDNFDNYKYSDEFVLRARNVAIKKWNTRKKILKDEML